MMTTRAERGDLYIYHGIYKCQIYEKKPSSGELAQAR